MKIKKLVGTNSSFIFESVNNILLNSELFQSMAKSYWIYGDGSASKKIADIQVDEFQGNLKINQNSEIFQNSFD